jgi:hypothetical protein
MQQCCTVVTAASGAKLLQHVRSNISVSNIAIVSMSPGTSLGFGSTMLARHPAAATAQLYGMHGVTQTSRATVGLRWNSAYIGGNAFIGGSDQTESSTMGPTILVATILGCISISDRQVQNFQVDSACTKW